MLLSTDLDIGRTTDLDIGRTTDLDVVRVIVQGFVGVVQRSFGVSNLQETLRTGNQGVLISRSEFKGLDELLLL